MRTDWMGERAPESGRHAAVAVRRDGVGSSGELCGACPRVGQGRGAGENAPAVMAGRQRRERDSGDRRAELRLAAAARRRLITERDRRGVADAEFRRERGRVL